MTTANNPKITGKLFGAEAAVPNSEQRVLFVSQMTSTGTATAGELNQDVTEATAKTLAGAPSQVYNAIEDYKIENEDVPVDLVLLDDPAGVAATATITFTATAATENGSLEFILGDARNGTFTLPVTKDDDEDALAAALAALITAEAKCMVSAVAVLNVVTLTAENVGLIGNSLPIINSGLVGGVSVATTAMTGGTLAPALTNVFDVVGETRYQTIVWHAEYTTSEVKTFLDARFNVTGQVKDGVAVMTAVDSKANLTTLGDANNSQSVVIFGEKTTSLSTWKGGSQKKAPLVQSAAFAAVRSLRLTDGANIANIVNSSVGALDTTGGPALASLPYFNTPMATIPVTPNGIGWTSTEINDLEDAGISVMGNNRTGTGVLLDKVVTTYKTDGAGNPDISWKYLNYVDTGSQAREYQVNNSLKDWAQSRLTVGDLKAFRAIANENSIRDRFIKYFGDMSSAEYMLLQDGEDARQFYIDNLSVTLDFPNGKVTVINKLPIVPQFRELDLTSKLAFTI